jgi:hypothetical protein
MAAVLKDRFRIVLTIDTRGKPTGRWISPSSRAEHRKNRTKKALPLFEVMPQA